MKKIILVFIIVVALFGLFAYQVGQSFSNPDIALKPIEDSYSVVLPVHIGHANAYFIKTETGYIMVDSGMPMNNEKIDELFNTAEINPQDVTLLVATHGHLDHIGMMGYLKSITGAKLLAHESLKDVLSSGQYENATAQSNKGTFMNMMMSLLPSTPSKIDVDLAISKSYSLNDYGITGTVIITPGHSPSSLAIVLDNGEALVGDMVRPDGEGQLGLGMYYEDTQQVYDDIDKIASYNPTRIYLSHGDVVDLETFKSVTIN